MLKFSLGRRGILLAVGVGLVLTLALEAFLLWEIREERWNGAVLSAENILHTLTSDIDRNLNLLDLSLQGTQDALARADLTAMNPVTRNMVLFDRASSATYLGSMLVLSPTGDVIYDAGAPLAREGNFADRDYFQAQQAADIAPYLSRPFGGRFRDGDLSIALSRRVTGRDGSFGGVVMGAISLRFFKDLFERVAVGPGGVVNLVRSDGRILMRWPSTDGQGNIGLDVANSEPFRRIVNGGNGFFTATAAIDGIQRHYVYGQVGKYPLTLVVAFSVTDVLATWRKQAIAFLLISCAATISILTLVVALQRALRREIIMSARLESLATTDWLTGLANRRHFDERLANLGRGAARARVPLSLLMIDVDRFKTLNDRFGHGKGDEVLRAIGQAIAGCARRPDDMVARYGGEEFSAILPGTDAVAAMGVAEAMRKQVESAVGQPDMPVTVSIGVATSLWPHDDLRRRLDAADMALYQAKSAGRNRVELADSAAPASPSQPRAHAPDEIAF